MCNILYLISHFLPHFLKKLVKHMKKIPLSSRVFGCLAGVLAAAVLVICLTQRNAKPLLLQTPQGAAECAQTMMDRICAGDYAGASLCLYGTPDLDSGSQDESPTARLIWNAFLSSLSCRPQGDCYADENGLAQDYILSGLDIPSLIEQMKKSAPAVLEAKLDAAESFVQVYDDNWQYREDFTQSVLEETARQATAAGAVVERAVTLRLIYENDQWWVVPSQELIAAISGGLV